MTTKIDGKAIARRVRDQVAADVAAAYPDPATAPGLATILVGDDPASALYVSSKRRAVREAGMRDLHQSLPEDSTQAAVAAVIDDLSADPAVSGILLQLPLPPGLDPAALIDRIPVTKDVDGLTTESAGLLARGEFGLRPCTPSGVIELLEAEGIKMRGAHAVVVGRSALVGHPMAEMLLHRDATITVAHKPTTDLASVTRLADILVVAAGVRGLIGAEHVKPGATVIDVGIHRTSSGLAGDVRTAELEGIADHVTPVPGGVGPMTIAMLMRNTLRAARWAQQRTGSTYVPEESHADRRIDLAAAERASRQFLHALDISTDDETMRRTPRRMAKAYAEFLTPRPFDLTTFPNDGNYDELVLAREIPFHSVCEHHLLPFFGKAAVGYLPDERILGLSKLARVVEHFALRPQVQERLTKQIADWLDRELRPKGVGVLIEAEHTCMSLRGVQAIGANTVTSAVLGTLRADVRSRQEFLAMARNR